jgi:hypothetical protein
MKPSSPPLRAVDAKVIVGYFSTSKKSALRMCASRCSWPVLIEDRSTEAVTDEASGSSAVTIVPSNLSKRLRTC